MQSRPKLRGRRKCFDRNKGHIWRWGKKKSPVGGNAICVILRRARKLGEFYGTKKKRECTRAFWKEGKVVSARIWTEKGGLQRKEVLAGRALRYQEVSKNGSPSR